MRPSPADLARFDDMACQIRWRMSRSRSSSAPTDVVMPAIKILLAMYTLELQMDLLDPDNPDRDRVVMSWRRGAENPARVLSHVKGASDWQWGVDVSTRSAGSALSAGVEMAAAAREQGRSFRVFAVLLEVDENDEGFWRAAADAARRGLDNLVAIIRHPEARCGLERFGWNIAAMPSEESGAVFDAFVRVRAWSGSGRPCAIILPRLGLGEPVATARHSGVMAMAPDKEMAR